MKLRLGIFDSGIGGFSVLNSLLSTRTDVEVIYLADIARNPYGEKDNKEIRISQFKYQIGLKKRILMLF